MTISGHNITKLAAAAGVSERTIRNLLAGKSVHERTRRDVKIAAVQLGMRLPDHIRAPDQEPTPTIEEGKAK